jgi:hypothetical protein
VAREGEKRGSTVELNVLDANTYLKIRLNKPLRTLHIAIGGGSMLALLTAGKKTALEKTLTRQPHFTASNSHPGYGSVVSRELRSCLTNQAGMPGNPEEIPPFLQTNEK